MNYKPNKYTKIYWDIIARAKQRLITGYKERHHIIPRSLGGEDIAENIVELTAREHFICHLLLIRMVVNTDHRRKMIYAAWQQSRPRNYTGLTTTNRTYEILKKQMSESYRGRKRLPFSEEWKHNMSLRALGDKNPMFGRKHTEQSKERMSENRIGKCVGQDNPFYGKTHSIETIEKIREVNNRNHMCPHCGKSGASNVMRRWHFDKCKAYSNSQY